MSANRFLFITPSPPFEDSSGAHQRSRLLYQALAKLGPVDVVVLESGAAVVATRQDRQTDRVVLATVPESNTHRRFRPNAQLTGALERALGQPLSAYRAVIGRYLWAATQLDVPPELPLIVDLDDFRYRYSRQASTSVPVLAERGRKALSHALACRQLPRIRGAFFASARDRAEHPAIDSVLLPNIPPRVPVVAPADLGRIRLLFVGSLWYRPNREAIGWFIARVWPRVRARYPAAELRLVGAAADTIRQAWIKTPGVTAPGFVDDIAAEYAAATAVIAPIQSGGGTNIKILEALACGRPCVISAFCQQGFAELLQAERDMLVADGPDAFADQCLRAISDPALRERLARNGRDTVARTCSKALFDAVSTQFVDRICAAAGR